MKRRSFLGLLAALPFVRWPTPEEDSVYQWPLLDDIGGQDAYRAEMTFSSRLILDAETERRFRLGGLR